MGTSIKPPSVQAAVVAKSLAGESKSQIAEDLGIARNTVYKILSDAQLSDLVLEGKSGVYGLIPKAVKAFEHALDKHKTPEATLILRATGVLPQEQEGGSGVTLNFGVMPRRGECQKSA